MTIDEIELVALQLSLKIVEHDLAEGEKKIRRLAAKADGRARTIRRLLVPPPHPPAPPLVWIDDLESRLAALEEWREALTLLYGDPTKPRPKGVIYAKSTF